jgi:tetratricopeptide (TPR) repeat protein
LALLEPRRADLGDGDGAQILGRAYLQANRNEEAFALLQPHVTQRLESFHEAEKDYGEAVEKFYRVQIKLLERGVAPPAFFRRYDAAGTDEERSALVDAYLRERIDTDASLSRKRERMERESGVVPVALDLGIVRLRRARAMSDADARRRELEEAERTFLAIRGAAGDSAEFRLFLAQVYYWLGKPEQGRALLDELLESQERGTQIVLAVASTLKDVGALSEARELMEQAYEAAADDPERQMAAYHRAFIAEDTDDEISWLTRCNQADAHVRAALHSARGQRALLDGRDTEAARELRRAIDSYDAFNDDAGALNNAALACVALYELTGDRTDYEGALQRIERAVEIRADNSIMLLHLAGLQLESALIRVALERMDLGALRMRGSLRLISFLYADAKGREPVMKRLHAQRRLSDAVAHLDKVTVLAPKHPGAYAALAAINWSRSDTEAARRLHARTEDISFDLGDAERAARIRHAPAEAEERREIEIRIARRRTILASAGKADRPLDRAVACCELADALVAGQRAGLEVDPDEVVALAERAHGAAASSATAHTLIAALPISCARARRPSRRRPPAGGGRSWPPSIPARRPAWPQP